MTDDDRRLLVEKCGVLLHDVLVELRVLSFQEGNAKRINDLTDLTHNVPLYMVGRDDFVMGYLRAGFLDYARKYHPEADPAHSRYVALLDMDEPTFAGLYRRATYTWPEPELVPAAG
ncbi:MAG: hypothetical protein U0804_24380 [Gemmataceae bacterium]